MALSIKCDSLARMYADDTNVTFSAATIPDLEYQINSDLKYIDRCLKANLLSLNFANMEFMFIGSRQKIQSLNYYTTNIHIDGVPTNQSKSLGLIMKISLGRLTFMKSLKKNPLVSVLLSRSGHLFQYILRLKHRKVLSSHTSSIAAL